jgi:hypothetical protein
MKGETKGEERTGPPSRRNSRRERSRRPRTSGWPCSGSSASSGPEVRHRTSRPSQSSALSRIEQAGPVRLGSLAELEGTTAATMSRVIDSLADRQLIERVPDPDWTAGPAWCG